MIATDNDGRPLQAGFTLADWTVHPELNRLVHGSSSVQLEPRLMDVLTFLAGRAGQVVSKDELIDRVWKLEFISDWAVTRAIAKLRQALGDDANSPTFIETISKRGYRLIAPVTPVGEPRSIVPTPQAGSPEGAPTSARSPYAVGQWVRGARFYGRKAEIDEILHGNRDSLWVVGTRCVGKTSLLKELDRIAQESPELGFVPLFWDLEGAEDAADLGCQFAEAVAEAGARWSALGVSVPEAEEADLFASLGNLRRALVTKGLRLLLLCDEAEELVQLQERSPATVRKLRRALHSQEGVRSVLAAGSRLWVLAEPTGDTSPFLHGLTPPLYLGPLAEMDSEKLILQAQLGAQARPRLTDDDIAAIRMHAGGHPYLLQLLCDRAAELGDMEQAISEVAADPSVHRLYSVDFSMLGESEQAVLRSLAWEPDPSGETAAARGSTPPLARSLLELERLGFVRRTGPGSYEIPSYFLEQWLRAQL